MTLRAKILLAQTPLAAALALIALLAALTNASLGRNTASILQDNYRSVLAVEQMKEALDRLDAATTAAGAARPGRTARRRGRTWRGSNRRCPSSAATSPSAASRRPRPR